VHRDVYVRHRVRIGAEELGRRHTHDREGDIVDTNRLADSALRPAESPFAQRMADDRNSCRARLVIVGREQASCERSDAETAKIFA
jgi:hypothetical protein